MDQDPLVPARKYVVRIGTQTIASASVTAIKYRIDVNTREHLAATAQPERDCVLQFRHPVAFDPYEANRRTGAFIVIDRYTNRTVGAGMIAFPLRRASNIAWQPLSIGRPNVSRSKT